MRRIDPQRFAELRGRFFIVPKLKQGRAQFIMRIGVCGVEAYRLGIFLYRFGEPMRPHKDLAHIEMGRCLIGFDGQRMPEFLQRFLR